RPTRALRTGRPLPRRGVEPRERAPLFGLAPCGVLPATRVATGAVRSYRTFSPLPVRGTGALEYVLRGSRPPYRRYVFCATVLQVTLTGRYPAHCPAEFGLSSRLRDANPCRACRAEGGRLSGSLRRINCTTRPSPARSDTAPASCIDCSGACRSLRRS